MDFRALIVAFALLCLCVCPSYGGITTGDPIILIDTMVDQVSSQARNVEVSFQVKLEGGTNPQLCKTGGDAVTVTSTDPLVTTAVAYTTSPPCSTSPCFDMVKVTFTLAAGYCATSSTFGGTFPLSYTPCDGTTAVSAAVTGKSLALADRNVCISSSPSIAVVTANIVPSGPFADATFSNDKNGIFSINDVVYFPFKVTYNGLTISKLAFNTITVVSGSSSLDLYTTSTSDSSNTGAGNTIGLQTTTTGTSTVWFSVRLNREAGSPFADTPGGSTTPYTFYVTFDVTYKNAKRSMQPEQGEQLRSAATIRIVNEEPAAIQANTNTAEVQTPSNTAHTLQAGMMCLTFLLALYFAY